MKNQNNNEIKIIEKKESGVSEFIKKPLPTEKEVEEFEEILEDEARDDEIDEGLSEIYQDENGDVPNVRKLDIKKKRGFIFWFLSVIFTVSIISIAGYGIYYLIYHVGSDATAVDFTIEGQDKIIAGEEFFIDLNYKNLSITNVRKIRIELNYPDNFIFLDSSPLTQSNPSDTNGRITKSIWELDDIGPKGNGQVKIKGMVIGQEDMANIFFAQITYMPENFSSEFKKESTFTVLVDGIGLNVNAEYATASLVGEKNEIIIGISVNENNYLSKFNLEIDSLENLEVIGLTAPVTNEKKEPSLIIEEIDDKTWQISGLKEIISPDSTTVDQELKIEYMLNKKIEDNQDFTLRLVQTDEKDLKYIFWEKIINLEIMNSDLNLTLIINGSKNDQVIDFENKLNYSIVYANKGETSMKDVIIMAVLDSDFLDWTTLKDKNNGRERGNTISWSKEEIKGFEELEINEEGIIDFSINTLPFRESDLGKDFQVKSYAQYNIGNIEEFSNQAQEDMDNRSNTIINKINSDLNLEEEARYFSKDNIPVGAGPLPPKVGEKTSFKVYWTLNNNLHELTEALVEVKLPDYVSWESRNRTSVGGLSYEGGSHKVIWRIGRLPVSVYQSEAEFSISITPTENDRDKIMVLIPGSTIRAIDSETGASLERSTKAKTTKLEEDEIAALSSDGRVE
ncbi:MAG: hypothetical protein ABIE43_00970 [Patescibacteria group bacterium]